MAEIGSQLDDDDMAYLKTFLPEGAVPIGILSVPLWLDPDGILRFKVVTPADVDIATCLGVLEVMRAELVDYIRGADDG